MFKEEFVTVAPKNVLLYKHIPYYYFYQTFDPQFSKHFHYYPHYRLGLTIQKNSLVTWDDNIRISKPKKGETSIVLTKNLEKCRLAMDYGIINKICVAFEPLGINHFIEAPLGSITDGSLSYFNFFGEEFSQLCDAVFDSADIDTKVLMLDDFFEKKLRSFSESRISNAVELIMENGQNNAIQQIADRVGVNRKMLNRLFQKHLGCSPQLFKHNVKFRNAINQYHASKTFQNFTQIAYDNHYYDQADLIHHFKKLSGKAPKSLFSSLSQVGPFDIYWSIQNPIMSQITNFASFP